MYHLVLFFNRVLILLLKLLLLGLE